MVDLTRRKIILGTTGLVAVAGTGIGAYKYLHNVPMDKAPEREGWLLLDGHTHTPKGKEEDLVKLFSSHGITGLSCIREQGNEHRLLFEEALNLPDVVQIDYALARIEFDGNVGYILRDQELTGTNSHILSVGVSGEYLDNDLDPRAAVEIIQSMEGAAILNHMFVTPNNNPHVGPSYLKYRLLLPEERVTRYELAQMVNEIEIFNSQNINPTLGLLGIPDMRQANDLAEVVVEVLVETRPIKGVVSTDSRLFEQTKLCGIYIPKPQGEPLTTEYIVDKINTHNFENDDRRYVSRWSFGDGMDLI